MLDKLTYISSTNREIHFGEGNIIINTNAFRDYEWKYSQSYKRITDFSKDVKMLRYKTYTNSNPIGADANRSAISLSIMPMYRAVTEDEE